MQSPERASARAFLLNWWSRRSRAEAMLREMAEAIERKFFTRDDRLPLADLARFCNAGDSTFDSDPLRMAANAGRREVWLHIRACLGLSEEDTDELLEETEQ